MILCLETATKNCSVALFEHTNGNGVGSMVAFKEAHGEKFIHGEQLHLFIDEVLRAAQCAATQLTAVAVGRGPGSFTGLRIGVSAAKGLAYALQIPLLSVPTLGCFDLNSLEEDRALCVLDARRDEVFYQWWRRQEDETWSPEGTPNYEIITPDSWALLDEEPSAVAVLGDCVEKVAQLLQGQRANWHFYPSALPSAQTTAPLLEQALVAGPEDVAYFEPFYLKDFVAEKSKKKLL